MMIYIFSSYGAALYIGCWSCTNYGAAHAAPAVWLSPPMGGLTTHSRWCGWSLACLSCNCNNVCVNSGDL